LFRFWRLTMCSNAGAMADTASFASDGYKDLLLRQNSMKTVSALASALTACCCLISQALFADVTVTIQPATNYFVPGGSATFNAQVTATGGETVRSYAWLLATNLNPPTIVIAGANTAVLTLTDIQPNEVGYYYAEVSYDSHGATGLTAESGPAYLLPVVGPVITSATNAFGLQGVPFTFNVTATGSEPLTFEASGLPPGLNIDTNSGVISGVPTAIGLFTATIEVSNRLSTETNLTFNIVSDIPGIDSSLTAAGQ